MPDAIAAIRQELRELRVLAAVAESKPEQLNKLLGRLTALHEVVQDARQAVADLGPPAVTQALQAGVEPDDLVGRPYSESQVRKFARDAGLPPRRRGPRRRPVDDGSSSERSSDASV